MSLPSINELFAKAVDGDKEAENQLFVILTERFRFFALQRIGNLTEVEDIIQSAVLVVYEKYRTVEITSSFTSWAYKILQFTILDHHQRSKRRARLDEVYQEEAAGRVTFNEMPFNELKKKVINCFKQINRKKPQYARILNLVHLGYNTDEICEKLKVTPNYMYTILSRARSLLLNCLERGKIK